MVGMDVEKEKDLVPLVEVNTTAAREHVGLIKQNIWHLKEKERPFRTYRGVRFTRSQIYLIFDVSVIQKLTVSSARVLTLLTDVKIE